MQSGHNTQGTSLPRIFNENRFVQFVIVSFILSRVTHAFHFASLQRVIRDMALVNEKYSVLELSLLKLVTPDIYSTHKIVGLRSHHPVVYKIPSLARALGLKARPSARATIVYIVYNPFSYWEANEQKYLTLASLARRYTVRVLAHVFSGLRETFQGRKAYNEGENHAQTREY